MIRLEPGKRYRVEARDQTRTRLVQFLAGALVADMTPFVLWSDPADLPADWPENRREPGAVWAEFVWPEGAAEVDFEPPPWLEAWEAAPAPSSPAPPEPEPLPELPPPPAPRPAPAPAPEPPPAALPSRRWLGALSLLAVVAGGLGLIAGRKNL